jgi:branched-chain amino acid aminotransferase
MTLPRGSCRRLAILRRSGTERNAGQARRRAAASPARPTASDLGLCQQICWRILMHLMRLTGLREAYVELVCTRGAPPKSSRDPRRCENRFYAFAIPFLWIATEEQRERGLHLHISAIPRIPPQSVDPRIKNFHWGDMNRGIFEAFEAGCDLPRSGRLRRQCRRRAGLQRVHGQGGRRDDARGHVPGCITRETALDLLAEQNVKVVIGAFSPDQLGAADEAFITSTAGGIVPVTRIDHRPLGDGEPGPVTTRLKNLYWQRHDDGRDSTAID